MVDVIASMPNKISAHGKNVYKDMKKVFVMGQYHKFLSKGPTGTFASSILSDSADNVLFNIQAGSCGIIRAITLVIAPTVASGAIKLAPTPYWLSQTSGVQFFKSTDNTEIQKILPDEIQEWLNTLEPAEFQMLAKYMNYDFDGLNVKDSQQLITKYYILPLPNNVLINTYNRAFKTDLNIQFNFQSAIVSSTGTNCTVSSANLLLYINYDDPPIGSDVDKALTMRTMQGIECSYLQTVNLTTTGTYAPSTTYKQQLFNFSGQCVYLWFVLRATKNNSLTNNVINNLIYGQIGDLINPATIQLLGPDQSPIFNSNLDTNFQTIYEPSQHFNGKLALENGQQVYRIFIDDPDNFWGRGVYRQSITMNNNFYLQFITSSNTAETEAAWTLIPQGAAAAGTPTTGHFQIGFCCPRYPGGSKTWITQHIAYNATAATILTAINNLGIPLLITNGTTTLNSTGITLTITGVTYQNEYFASYNQFNVFATSGISNASYPMTIDVVNSVVAVPMAGCFASGTYTLDVYGSFIRSVPIQDGRFGNSFVA